MEQNGLSAHMQASSNARALERLSRRVLDNSLDEAGLVNRRAHLAYLAAEVHKTRHLIL